MTTENQAPDEDTPPWDVDAEPGVGMSFTVAGVRFSTEIPGGLSTVEKSAPEIFKRIKSIEQAAIAAGVFGKVESKTPDPANNVSKAPTGDVPRCSHGLMKDLRGQVYGPKSAKKGQPYPHAFYCTAPWDAADKCDARD